MNSLRLVALACGLSSALVACSSDARGVEGEDQDSATSAVNAGSAPPPLVVGAYALADGKREGELTVTRVTGATASFSLSVAEDGKTGSLIDVEAKVEAGDWLYKEGSCRILLEQAAGKITIVQFGRCGFHGNVTAAGDFTSFKTPAVGAYELRASDRRGTLTIHESTPEWVTYSVRLENENGGRAASLDRKKATFRGRSYALFTEECAMGLEPEGEDIVVKQLGPCSSFGRDDVTAEGKYLKQ